MGRIYLKSLKRFLTQRPMFALLIVFLILCSTAITAYIYKLGMGFAYSSSGLEAPYAYVFSVSGDRLRDEAQLAEIFKAWEFRGAEKDPVGVTSFTLGGVSYTDDWTVEDDLYVHAGRLDEDKLEEFPSIGDYVGAAEIDAGEKYVLLDDTDARFASVEVGGTVEINGVAYTVKGKDIFLSEPEPNGSYSSAPSILYIMSEELMQSYDLFNIRIIVAQKIGNKQLKGIAAENGWRFESDSLPIMSGFYVLSAVFCALFALNGAILFKHLLDSQSKLYATYKMLGAKTGQILLTMVLQTLPVCLIGVLCGIGADFAVAPITTILDQHIRLDLVGVLAVAALNMVGMTVGFMAAAIKRARALPYDAKEGIA